MFELITTICSVGSASLVALGIAILLFVKNRAHRVVLGVALCLGSITIITMAVIIFYNNAPETAYKHHLQMLQQHPEQGEQ